MPTQSQPKLIAAKGPLWFMPGAGEGAGISSIERVDAKGSHHEEDSLIEVGGCRTGSSMMIEPERSETVSRETCDRLRVGLFQQGPRPRRVTFAWGCCGCCSKGGQHRSAAARLSSLAALLSSLSLLLVKLCCRAATGANVCPWQGDGRRRGQGRSSVGVCKQRAT